MKKPFTIEINVNPEPDRDKGESFLVVNTDCQSPWNLHNQKQLLRDLRKINKGKAIRYLDIKIPDNPYNMNIFNEHVFPKLRNKAVLGVEISNNTIITTNAEKRNAIRFIINSMVRLYNTMDYIDTVYFHLNSIESVPILEEDWIFILWSVIDSLDPDSQKRISWKRWNHVYQITTKEIEESYSKNGPSTNLWHLVNSVSKEETYHGEYIIEAYTGQGDSITRYELFEIETDDYINWRSGIQEADENLSDVLEAVFIDPDRPDDGNYI